MYYHRRPPHPQIIPSLIHLTSWKKGPTTSERGLWRHRRIMRRVLCSPPSVGSGLCRQCQRQHGGAAWKATVDAMRSGPATGMDAFASSSRGQPSSYRFLSCYVQLRMLCTDQVPRRRETLRGREASAILDVGCFPYCMHASTFACLRCTSRTIKGALLDGRPPEPSQEVGTCLLSSPHGWPNTSQPASSGQRRRGGAGPPRCSHVQLPPERWTNGSGSRGRSSDGILKA